MTDFNGSPGAPPNSGSTPGQVHEALAQMRRKLLDRTAHNPLISFKHGRSSRYVRIVDELPDQLAEHLYNGKELTFKPVPEPRPEELEAWIAEGGEMKGKLPPVEAWAGRLRLRISPDLPTETGDRSVRRYTDLQIQTGYYPAVLEARLGALYKLSRTAIEETGTNFLHLVFGFLEWYESPDSDKPRFAPLYTIPVALDKGRLDARTSTYQYSLALGEEELQFNASLAARLHEDFGFVLPEIATDAEDSSPEAYLSKIERKIRPSFPRWKVHRWGTVTLLNFSRLMMYRDLDPENWPPGASLAEHPLVQAVVSGAAEPGDSPPGGLMADEHEIDSIEAIHDSYPLVDVADSSQHSALIDALDGHDLIVQGPPGTGKSQTITNLIAAAMHQGKSVLFVSEKLAALEVVKNRMERLGLGQFCLELHSHTTKKIGVIESLKQRYEAQFPSPAALDSEVRRHAALLAELRDHASRINRPWKATGMTVHEILAGATRHLLDLDTTFEGLRVESIDGSRWSRDHHANIQRDLRTFHGQVEALARDIGSREIGLAHPWRGVTAAGLDAGSVPEVVRRLAKWRDAIAVLAESVAAFPAAAVLGKTSTPEEVGEAVRAIKASPDPAPMEEWETLGELSSGGLARLDELIRAVEGLHERAASVGALPLDAIVAEEAIPDLADRVGSLMVTGLPGGVALPELSELNDSVEKVGKALRKWTGLLGEYESFVGVPLPEVIRPDRLSSRSFGILAEMLELASMLDGPDLDCRNSDLLPERLGEDYPGFRKRLASLRTQRENLGKVFVLEKARATADIPTLLERLAEPSALKRLLAGSYRGAKAVVVDWLQAGRKGWDRAGILDALPGLVAYLDAERAFLEDERWKKALGKAFKGIDTRPEAVDAFVDWHKRLADAFRTQQGGFFGSPVLGEPGRWLVEQSSACLQGLLKLREAGLDEDREAVHGRFATVCRLYGHPEPPADDRLVGDSSRWSGVLVYLEDNLPVVLRECSLLQVQDPLTLAGVSAMMSEYLEIQGQWEQISTMYASINSRLFGGRLPNSPMLVEEVRRIAMPARRWCEWLVDQGTPKGIAAAVVSGGSRSFVERLRSWADTADAFCGDEVDTRRDFANRVELDASAWGKDRTLRAYRLRADEALGAEAMLPAYLAFLRSKARLVAEGLASLCSRVETPAVAPERLETALGYIVHRSLADEILMEEPELRRFDGIHQSETQRQFMESDRRIFEIMRQRMASQISRREIDPGYRGARVSEHTGLELLKREMAKQKRHVPLRQLLSRAGEALQGLKPCFMMGPRSVAQYLEPGAVTFDLLVIDEASQMRPADALGAVARCRQLVVVGDSKQLAPTSFFDRLSGAEDDEEDQFEAAVSESILDAVEPIFRSRQLRWHYRSRHESLIAFSNHQFYDNRLMLFPSPYFGNEALGIRFHYVDAGIFESQVNQAEAERVAERAEHLLTANPEESVGIATMNAKQRDLIDRLIESRSKANPLFANALDRNREQEEPLFVKNLENVQGDEREIMIISCTYGKDQAAGKVHQRFGPINSQDGWRRLNVLFTRSRSRMEIFSSMSSSDILVGDTSSDGVRALKGMLHYAETKKLQIERSSGREPDSDFEIAVASMLKKAGYRTDCQIGVSGFFIDLAVKHPTKADEYVMGIECDGAAYHSGKSVRDRDRLRQEILEGMGWKIRRIWSTDWFENPKRAIRPILEELRGLGAGD